MKYVSDKDILKLQISPKQAVQWVKNSFLTKSKSILPPKTSIRIDETNYFNTMPAMIPEYKILGAKIIDRFINRNPKVDGQIYIYDWENGDLRYILDAFWITTARTGACCALALNTFAKSNFKTIGIMGLGNTAKASLSCILETNLDKKLTIKLLKYKNHCEKIIEQYKKYENVEFILVETIKELIEDSDVVISCITNTNEILAQPEWFKEGCLLIPVHTKGFQSCDTVFEKIFGDDTGNISHFKYFNQYRQYAEFEEVLNGSKEGRTNDKERIISYNLGIAMHDLIFVKNIIDLINEKEIKEFELEKNINDFSFSN